MEHEATLGRSDLRVPRMGVGAMTWGEAKGLARLHPAKTAYGGCIPPRPPTAARTARKRSSALLS